MSFLDSLLGDNQSAIFSSIAQKTGMSADQLQGLAGQLMPSLQQATKQQLADNAAGDTVSNQIAGNDQVAFVENPEALQSDEATQAGENLLGQLLGGGQQTQALTEKAAQQSGLDASAISKALPMLTTAFMGGLQKQTGDVASNEADSNSIMGKLGGFLDQDGDGSFLDDITDIGGGLFKKFAS